jgi:hypothetical protein
VDQHRSFARQQKRRFDPLEQVAEVPGHLAHPRTHPGTPVSMEAAAGPRRSCARAD